MPRDKSSEGSNKDANNDPSRVRRTYERTDVEGNNDSASVQLSDAQEFTSIADVIEAGFMPTGERFPLVRSGERAEIPWHVRAAVYYRDGARCQFCKLIRPRPWHLDHIVPWSAGGPDTTENLRLLCEPCNMRRSNCDDKMTALKLPCTWWCHRCYLDTSRWEYHPSGAVLHREPPHDSEIDEPGPSWHGCRVAAITQKQVQQGERPTWHERQRIVAPTIRAFCAHCNAPGLTDKTL